MRMPVWWGNFYSITNTTSSGWRTDAFTVLDWLVTNCAARGIYVIIDMHGVVGGQGTSDDTGGQIKTNIGPAPPIKAKPSSCGNKSRLTTTATAPWPVTI